MFGGSALKTLLNALEIIQQQFLKLICLNDKIYNYSDELFGNIKQSFFKKITSFK